jgi:2'-5' RNA ligase
MVYAVVIYPELKDDSKIQEFRKKYDPQFKLIKPHITIVFPFSDLEKEKIKIHLSKTIKNFKPFKLRLSGLVKSFDNWLFLIGKDGNNELIELHDQFYTGILKKYLRKDVEYIPHIGLGLFKTGEEYSKAETEAKKLNLDYECYVKSVYLIHLKDDLSKIDWFEEFSL